MEWHLWRMSKNDTMSCAPLLIDVGRFESNIKSVLLRQLGENSPAPPIFTVS